MKLEADNISKSFGKQAAIRRVSFRIPECRSVAFIGPSGGGKSTLLRLVAGLEYPDQGTISINDSQIIYEEEKLRAYRRTIGTVFQSWNLFPHLTALENICLPLVHVHGYSEKGAKERGMELLSRFHLQDHANKMPYQLSGGQVQRAAIVRAVAIRPKLLLFDEPTSALDPVMTGEVLDLIFELKAEGINFILVSHHMSFIRMISDWVVYLSEGRMEEVASKESFFKEPQSQAAKDFLQKVLKY